MIPFVFLLIESDEDRLFLEGVYLEYHRLMYAQALQITRRSEAAEDAVSDSLLALMKKIDLLRTLPCNKLRSYLVITVKRAAGGSSRTTARPSSACRGDGPPMKACLPRRGWSG